MTLLAGAATTVTEPDITSYLAQFGIVGFAVLVLTVVVRYLFNKLDLQMTQRLADLQSQTEKRIDDMRHSHDLALHSRDEQIMQLLEDKRLLQRSNDDAVIFMRDRLVPALAEAAKITGEYVSELRRRGQL